jgi:foldase protein PrsA
MFNGKVKRGWGLKAQIGSRRRVGILWGVLWFFLIPWGNAFGSEPEALLPAAEVNQAPISAGEVERAVRDYLRQIGHRELSPPRMVILRREILARLIDEELIYQEGLKKGLAVSDAEMEVEITRIRKRFSSSEAFDAALQKEELSLNDIKEGVQRFILIRKMRESIREWSDLDKTNWLEDLRQKAEIKIY